MIQHLYFDACRLKLRISSAFSLSGFSLAIAALTAMPALAQIIPDATLGNEPSIVSPAQTIRGLPATLIEGGALRGKNLFQSFREFNVGDGQRVYFANPAGVESILSRITGVNPSRILGLLGVDGTANLFLMNPNGILFGANARLDIAGSFVATTANSLTFDNGLTFSAQNPEAPPMLTVTLRPHLTYGTHYQGPIHQAGNLAVGSGQTLSLQGQTVTSTGSLMAPGGTVQVLGDRIALLEQATIDVSGSGGGGTVLIGGEFQGQGPVPNATQTLVTAEVTIRADAIAQGDGGRVIVWADQDTQFAGQISARGGATLGNGGLVEVSGKQTLKFNGAVDTTAPQGRPGQLLLDPFDLELNQALISGSEVRFLADNNITFNAPVTITGVGEGLFANAGNNIFVNRNLTTDGGDIVLRAGNGVFLNRVTLETNPSEAAGTFAGAIVLSGGNQVSVTDSALFSRSNNDRVSFSAIGIVSPNGSVQIDNSTISTTNFGTGFAGDVAITAGDQVAIANSGIFSRGNLGRVYIGESNYNEFDFSPDQVTISRSQIVTSNDSVPIGATADAGLIFVQANNSVSIGDNSSLLSRAAPGRQGSSGGVGIASEFLDVSDSSISTSTFAGGSAGAVVLLIEKDAVFTNSRIFSNLSNLSADSSSGFGFNGFNGLGNSSTAPQAGAILIGAGSFSLLNGSQIQTSVIGAAEDATDNQGSAGNILIATSGTVKIIGTNSAGLPSAIFADVERGASGRGGNILIGAKSIQVRDRGRIDANNAGQGTAGNVFLFTRALWLDNRARITASSQDGRGGNIVLNVPGAIIIGRNSSISTIAFSNSFGERAGNIIIGSGDLIDTVTIQNGRLFLSPAFDGSTLLIAGKTPRDNNIFSVGLFSAGGNIRINAGRLQNIAQRFPSLTTNDISAASGIGVDGSVVVNALNIFPSFRVDPLPERTDVPEISQGCDPRVRQESSQFTLSGRGGLPPNAADGLTPSTFAEIPTPATTASQPAAASAPAIAPARGWMRNPDGTIRLVAQVTDPADAIVPVPFRYSPPCYVP